jgi:phosphatidylinositol-3,4,5-trisphosphate 3-phosphatase/dual-specificity protein phosphatase PTEN
VAAPRSPSPSVGKAPKSGKKEKEKVDAFRFDPATDASGGLCYERGAAAPWLAHDPEARLPVEAITPKKTFCTGVGGSALKTFRTAVSKKKKRFVEDGFDLDLTYITPKIIAMGFPSVGREGLYRNPLPEVQRFFETRHAGRYRIYNLCSEKAYDPADFLGRVCRYPFDDHNPCPLHVIAGFCEDVDSWLTAHPDNVAAIHCKAGKGRTGLVISCFLMHCGFKPSAEQALKFFGVQRTANAKGVTIPSQMRYVHYYEQILRHGFPVTYTYRVSHVRIRGVPTLELGSSACTPWFQLLVDGARVFDYKKACGGSKDLPRFRKGEPYMDLDCSGFDVRIANNVKLQVNLTGSVAKCHLWFHTGFITRNVLVFGRGVIDKLSKDTKGKKVPRNFAIELYLHRVAAMPLAPGEQEAQIAAASAQALAASESGALAASGSGGDSSGSGSASSTPRATAAAGGKKGAGGSGKASRRSSMSSAGSARSAASSAGGNSSGSEGGTSDDDDDGDS